MQEVQVIENHFISMSDGCKIAVKIWLPTSSISKPVPAILEYIPYRKRDFKAVRDEQTYRFFAENGYAGIRADLRGSGDSEGILRDEYLQQELDDGVEILRWIGSQNWCDGNIGMMGISWGGFNALQIAAMQPPELKAIITVASSEHRYSDDVHYMGGNLLTDNLSWASTMFAYNSCPPDPEIVGEKWKSIWLDRLSGSGLWLKKWLEHQRFDKYWMHGSVSMDYTKIKCPVFAVSGWADGYSNTVFRLLENLNVPCKGMVGPWGHKYPHLGGPGPVIDFLKEALRWWDKYLKDRENGVDKEPQLRVWMQDTVSPISSKRPGHWVAEEKWSEESIEIKKFSLKPGHIDFHEELPEFSLEQSIQSPLSVGLFAGKWCSYAASTDLPSDQREEDGGSLVYDTLPLKEEIEILGAPSIRLKLSTDKPIAQVAVRISDVAPNGRATRVTYGVLNLTHHESDEKPIELKPGKKYKVNVPMNYIAQRFPKGHQIRLSISSSYWPLIWPSPEPTNITIFPSESRLYLPIRSQKEIDKTLHELGEPELHDHIKTTLLVPAKREWKVIHNLATNDVSLNVVNNDDKFRLDDYNWTVCKNVTEKYSYQNNNYDTVKGEVISERSFKRNSWEVYTITKTILTSTKTHFVIRATMDAYEGDTRIFSKSWDEQVQRDLL